MAKIKQVITPENRISMFQTAMNNAGRNFQGKRIPVSKMAEFATQFYKIAIAEISEIGKMELTTLEKILTVKKVSRVAKKADLKRLMHRVKKSNGKRHAKKSNGKRRSK
jgi:hypothetical protein